MIYYDINFKICLSLFGWTENILHKQHILQFWRRVPDTPWPHGRGILLFSTHLLATARWAWAPPCSWWWGRLRWWRLPPWCLLNGLTTWRRCVSALQGTPPHLSGSACLDGNWENLHLFLVCSPSPILLSFYPYTSKPSCSSKHLLQNWLCWWGSVGAEYKNTFESISIVH